MGGASTTHGRANHQPRIQVTRSRLEREKSGPFREITWGAPGEVTVRDYEGA